MVDRADQADVILQQIKQAESGQLTIFLGAAPGVGKTYAMLSAAKEMQQQGVDVVVGLVETHQRVETEAMLQDMEILPRQQIHYHQSQLTEFDLDGALSRQPTLILVDELAHTNVPGSRHRRRYQDIAELLSHGIDVYTSLNVQHLASVNDLVLQITGVRVHETVPDQFIDNASEVRFIDLSPQALIDRLKQGKVYLPEYARSALQSFFSQRNLTALRELAMREVMSRVDEQLDAEQMIQPHHRPFSIQEKLLVLISCQQDHEPLIRIGRQIAERRKIAWMVVWVDTGKPLSKPAAERRQTAFSVAQELGAMTEVLKGPSTYQTILPFITENRINTVLVGAGGRFHFWRKRLYQRLIESGLPLEVSVFRFSEPQRSALRLKSANELTSRTFQWRPHIYGLLAVLATTLLAIPLERLLTNANLVLVFVIAVVMTGLKGGWQPAITASLGSFLSFNFFFTEPRYTFHVARQDEITTLIFLLLIALACGPAASLIRRQFQLLREANRYSESLRGLSQALSVADDEKMVWDALITAISKSVSAKVVVVPNFQYSELTHWPAQPLTFTAVDKAAVDWSQKQRSMSGRFTDTLNAAGWSVFPITKENWQIACLAIQFEADKTALTQEDKAVITTMNQLAADTWRRVRLVGEVETARVKTEVEQLRSALLSSVSHDLKSPLAAMMGSAESLKVLEKQLSETDRHELVDTILLESRRLDTYIQNLLDMTRLGYGTLKIERDWVSISDVIGGALSRLKRYYPAVMTQFTVLNLPPLMYIHAALIEQALFNILENAARFSPVDEAIVVTIDHQQQSCVITIDDKGPGIPVALREQIFDMFYVVSSGDTKKSNTGMGLAICKGMIGAHGGTVSASVGPDNVGTRFSISLPTISPLTGEKAKLE